LTPTIALATGATISPLSGTSNNFSSPASYTVTAQDGTTQQAYTVTVTVSAAPVSSGGGGGGGGSTSGGGSGYAYNYNQILNNAINNKTIQPVVNQSTSYIFTKNMTVNTRSTDIMTLQQFLNRNGYPVATSGPGSLGNETNYFGTLTFKALIRFQRSVGLPATGYFGPMTRELIKKSKVFK
jgi:peptidoglycan hydrolase-like protein with peptidoglycan-binding domain